jgi:hypothetical protein
MTATTARPRTDVTPDDRIKKAIERLKPGALNALYSLARS